MNELHLFAGAGGGILGGQLLGHRTVCAVEWEPYAQAVLVARQNDGSFPPFPIWDDVQSFDGKPWRGRVDVVAGGFPCQDISVAGKGAGIDGARSGMWGHMARVVGEVRPRFVFVENSPALVNRGLGRVLGDLSALGYDSRWIVMGAADVGAPHQRDRLWILAHANGMRELQPQGSQQDQRGRPCDGCGHVFDQERLGVFGCPNCEGEMVNTHDQAENFAEPDQEEFTGTGLGGWSGKWDAEPDVGRVADGVALRSHRLKAIGNGQVPACAAAAWRTLGGP